MITINIPGRVISFYEGGQAHHDYETQLRRGEALHTTRNFSADELELFTAVDAGKTIRPSKGGYYVRAELTSGAVAAARYWAETLAVTSGDELSEPDNYNDNRAANRLLHKLDR